MHTPGLVDSERYPNVLKKMLPCKATGLYAAVKRPATLADAVCWYCHGRLVLTDDCNCNNEKFALEAQCWTKHSKSRKPWWTCGDCHLERHGYEPHCQVESVMNPHTTGEFLTCYAHRRAFAHCLGLREPSRPKAAPKPPPPKVQVPMLALPAPQAPASKHHARADCTHASAAHHSIHSDGSAAASSGEWQEVDNDSTVIAVPPGLPTPSVQDLMETIRELSDRLQALEQIVLRNGEPLPLS